MEENNQWSSSLEKRKRLTPILLKNNNDSYNNRARVNPT
jgi:hypothetical protein